VTTDNGANGTVQEWDYEYYDEETMETTTTTYEYNREGHGRGIIISAFHGETNRFCTIDIEATAGTGGDSNAATSNPLRGIAGASYVDVQLGSRATTTPFDFGTAWYTITDARTLAPFLSSFNSLSIEATVGGSGDGYERTRRTSGAIQYANVGGDNSTVTVSLNVGDGGDGGRGDYYDPLVGPLGYVSSDSWGQYEQETISCIVGNSGEPDGTVSGYTEYPASVIHVTNASRHRYQCSQDYYAEVGSESTGGGGLPIALCSYILADPAEYPAKFHAETATVGTASYDFQRNGVGIVTYLGTAPVQIDDKRHLSDILITEDDTYTIQAEGNYSRVEGASGFSDFFSGTTDGDNVPIDGYDSGGGGDTLGRFWEEMPT
jgi:hypothetical protein